MRRLFSVFLCLGLLILLLPSVLMAEEGTSTGGTPTVSVEDFAVERNAIKQQINYNNTQLEQAEAKVQQTKELRDKVYGGANHLFPLANYDRDVEIAIENRDLILSKLNELNRQLEKINSEEVSYYEFLIATNPNDRTLYTQVGQKYKEFGIQGIKVFVNGLRPTFDVNPFIENGRTLVPIRAIAEELGAKVDWNAETSTITLTKDQKVVVLIIGNNNASVDGESVTLDVPAKIVDGRTFIPLRFVAESFNTEVGYDGSTEIITIFSK